MLPVVWSEDADADLAEIIDYIAQHSPQAASKLAQRMKVKIRACLGFLATP